MFAVFVKFFKRKKKVKAEQEAAAYESQESSSKQEPTADAALFANVGKENKE